MMTLMSGKPTLHIMISILSILVFLIFLWMFDFFVPKNISCVFLISPEKYFAFFAFCRWRSLNWKRRRGESLLNWQQRRHRWNFSKLRIPIGSPFCQTQRHQVKAKKEACNGYEEEAKPKNLLCKSDNKLQMCFPVRKTNSSEYPSAPSSLSCSFKCTAVPTSC